MLVPEQLYTQLRSITLELPNNYLKYCKYMTKNSEFIFCCVTIVYYFWYEPLQDSCKSTNVDLFCLDSLTLFLFAEWMLENVNSIHVAFLRALNTSEQCLQL